MDDMKLAILPTAEECNFFREMGWRLQMSGLPDTEEETQNVGLFLLVEFTYVFVCTHLAL